MIDPLSVQVGGQHYKNLKIQPVEYAHANNMGYCEGAIIKYISRYKQKNGIEDLKKIKHFVDILIKLEYEKTTPIQTKTPIVLTNHV